MSRMCIFACSLFSYVNDGYTLSRPTYAALLRLQDNYNHVVGHAEYSTHTEEQEISNFLQEITKTTVIQKTLDFLSKKGLFSEITEKETRSPEEIPNGLKMKCFNNMGEVNLVDVHG